MADKPTEEDFQSNWIQARKNAGLTCYDIEESGGEKLMRKIRSNPFVPVGCILSATSLILGLVLSIRSENQRMAQLMMRGRILAQGFTVAAMVVGVSMKAAQDNSSQR